ncbi:hypothetical protein IAT38_000400 [Cryptococcus sp. DSM 104549]
MPPRKAAAVNASPARSARSARSTTREQGREDDEDNASIASGSFKVPKGRAKNPMGTLTGTSVNVQNAFATASFAGAHLQNLPTPTSDRGFPSHSGYNGDSSLLQVPRGPSPAYSHPASPHGSQTSRARAKSPTEELADSARALSPVRFFLQGGREGDVSGEYTSFSSAGNTSGASRSSARELSYDYRAEEEFVKQQRKGKSGRTSLGKKRKDEDMPYRPAEEGEAVYDSDDSSGEGEGIVRGGALAGRADTRGKTRERGIGYLGGDLAFQRSQPGRRRKNGDAGEDGEMEDYESQRAETPARSIRQASPFQVIRNGMSPLRSPTPQFAPGGIPARQPTTLGSIVGDVLHGIVLALQGLVELLSSIVVGGVANPARRIHVLSKDLAKKLGQDWWKWLGAAFALSLAVSYMSSAFRPKGIYRAPDIPPGSVDEMSSRLTNLEQATAALSDMLRAVSESEHEYELSSAAIRGRMDDLESAMVLERKRVESARGEASKDAKGMHSSLAALRAEIQELSSQVGSHEKSIAAAQASAAAISSAEREIAELKARVGKVEQGVRDALDDGRLLEAIEKILPSLMPIRVNRQGGVEVQPAFWVEMKKVMLERTEVEAVVKRLMGEAPKVKGDGEVDEKKLEQWMEKAFESRSRSGEFLSRSTFTTLLEAELQDLRREHATAKHPPSSKSAPITIKNGKGEDLTKLFNELIDAALLRYSKDTIARTDYALFTAGARVIPQLTSDTLTLSTASKAGKILWGSKDVQGRPPATALHPDISVGSCWPFKGQEGSLGVMLTRRVVVTDVTVEHAPGELALDTSTAPKTVQVMGIMDAEEDVQKFQRHWYNLGSDDTVPDHLPLGTFTYDPSGASHIQTFPVPSDIVDLGIKVGVVVFKVESNWGGDLTCLYRVRVHGEANAHVEE